MRQRPSQQAFTLIELLVVVAIIALLISILIPSLSRAREQARTVVCLSNMKQLGFAFILYTEEFNGHLPGGDHDAVLDRSQPHGYVSYSWLGTHPEINYFDNEGRRRRGWGGADPAQCPDRGTLFPFAGRQRDIYRCPSDKRREVSGGTRSYTKPVYSYTAPKSLTGVPIAKLEHTLYPDNFDDGWFTGQWDQDSHYLRVARPWIAIEEDELTMSRNDSAGWSSTDGLTDRHRAKGGIAFADGSAAHLEFQRDPLPLVARSTYFELGDGRIVSAGSGAAIKMNDLFRQAAGHPTEIQGKR